ncbi:MAG: GspH/FimT family pseudopilin [Endozoicomonas sp.]
MRRTSGKLSVRGYSLIEMMVVVTVIAIIFGISAPITEVVRDARHNYQASRFLKAASYAADEAIKRGVKVNICGSDSGTACDAASSSWPGWAVYVDSNGNGAFNTTEEILQFFHPKDDFKVKRSTGSSDLAFDENGVTSAATFWVCSSSSDDIVLQINAAGRRFAQHKAKQAVC